MPVLVNQTREGPVPLETPSQFPVVWNGTGNNMLPDRFAVWFHAKQEFQIYDVDRSRWPEIQLVPTLTSRTNSYFFASDVEYDTRSRTVTIFRPRARVHSHILMGIWYTGGWLCKRRDHQLRPVIPFLGVSDISKMTYVGNVGINENEDLRSWREFQAPRHIRDILQNRMVLPAVAEVVKKDSAPAAIPEFVATLLVQKARGDGQMCPITMDEFEEGDVGVTSCFHVFQRDALSTWVSKHGSCPVCKQVCSVTHV